MIFVYITKYVYICSELHKICEMTTFFSIDMHRFFFEFREKKKFFLTINIWILA